MTKPDSAWELTVRPVKSARISVVVAVLVVLAFLVIAAALPNESAGVTFTGADQWGIAGIGIMLGIGILSITRPRVRAGAVGVESRGFFGNARLIEWSLINRVEFVAKARFGRLALPGDEHIVLYAVQRGDAERSVAAMTTLRALHSRYGNRWTA